jgi:hypothetical protein
MESVPLLDCAGRRRSPATTSSFHRGRPPRNKGLRYPPDPPTVEEIIAVMRAAGDDLDGLRLRGVIVVLWRAGLRISEALALSESDLDPRRGSVPVRRGKGGKRREVGMDRWAWEQLEPGSPFARPCRSGRFSVCCAARRAVGRACLPGSVFSPTRPRGSPALRAAPGPARPRGRDVPRGRAAVGDPTAARARRSGDHVRVPARDRQHRDHPHRPRAASADDPRHQRSRAHPLTVGSQARPQASAIRCDVIDSP